MPSVARLGDAISHGGRIISASADTQANGLGVARIGDLAYCEKHGTVTIVGGAQTTSTNGPLTARVGDACSCGATITGGSPNRIVGYEGGSSGPAIKFTFPDGTPAELNEADLGSWDDEVDEQNPGVVVYPQIQGRPATSREIERSKELGYDPAAPSPPAEDKVTDAKPTPSTPVDCGEFPNPIDYGMFLSPSFKLETVSSKAVVSPTRVKAQRGLTELQIICNLKAVCVNVLEPIARRYGRQVIGITSGFRLQKNGRSQHEVGQAIDLQFSDQWSGALSKQGWWERVQWIKDNVPFDQMILEYIGNKPWIHLSYSETGNRKQLLTTTKNGKYDPGLILV